MSRRILVLFVVVISLALVTPSPIKEKEIDDIIFRLAEMKNGLHLEARNLDELGGGYLLKKKALDPLGGGHLIRNLDSLAASNGSDRHQYTVSNENSGEEITESDKNRLLYDYFVHPIGRYHGKRDFDEIDRYGFGLDKRFDEIDRFGFNKRMSRKSKLADHRGEDYKRNLDEIDRYGFSGLKRALN